MNSTVTARVEVELNLTINEGNIVRAAAARINAEAWSLDYTERFLDGLRIALNAEVEDTSLIAPWLVYRGGSHVALIKGTERIVLVTERIVLVTERRPEPEPVKPGWNDWKALPAYIQSAKGKAEALQACTGAVSVTVTDGDQTATVAAPQAPQATSRVQAYVDGLGGVEHHYAAAYAHWADEVGEDGAIAHAANRGKGLTGSAKQTIRRAIIAARAGV